MCGCKPAHASKSFLYECFSEYRAIWVFEKMYLSLKALYLYLSPPRSPKTMTIDYQEVHVGQGQLQSKNNFGIPFFDTQLTCLLPYHLVLA